MPQTQAFELRPLPDRTPGEAVDEILRDEELMRQVKASLEEERRGDPALPLSELLNEAKQRRSA